MSVVYGPASEEADERWPAWKNGTVPVAPEEEDRREALREAFVEGAEWAAGRAETTTEEWPRCKASRDGGCARCHDEHGRHVHCRAETTTMRGYYVPSDPPTYSDPGMEPHADHCHLQHGMGGMCSCGEESAPDTHADVTERAARVMRDLGMVQTRKIDGDECEWVNAPLSVVVEYLALNGLLATARVIN